MMFDMFRHPIDFPDETLLFNLNDINWFDWWNTQANNFFEAGIARANFCLMDSSVLENRQFIELIGSPLVEKKLCFSIMLNLDDIDVVERLELAAARGIRGLCFHSYLQKIGKRHSEIVETLALKADDLGMVIGFCTAYGSKEIYDYYSLPLVVKIVEKVKGPIILYHAGGAKVLEAMLLCQMWDNLWLDTSYSLPFWMGSSVEQDLAFAMRKIGVTRFLYGSDYPFVSDETASLQHLSFMKKYKFSERDQERLFCGNAMGLWS